MIVCYLRSWQRGTLPAPVHPLRLRLYVYNKVNKVKINTKNKINTKTYDCREESTGAERPERVGERERSEEENDGQQEDVGHGMGDVVVVARVSRQTPSSVDTLVLRHAPSMHLDASVGVVPTVRVQIAHPLVSVRAP